nr:MAG TPA: hypothetical protein [Caudoviricetes sp.]
MNGSAKEQEGHGTAVAYRTADAVKRNEEGGGKGTKREGDKERRGTRNDEGQGRGRGRQGKREAGRGQKERKR